MVLLNNELKEVVVALANAYTYLNINTQNTKLASLVNLIEKKINLVENLLNEVKKAF